MAQTHKFREILEGVKHVEAVIVDSGGRHRVVAQVEGLAELHYEPLIQDTYYSNDISGNYGVAVVLLFL